MSAEDTRATVLRTVARAYNRGALDALAAIYAADVVLHRPPLPDIQGLEAIKRYVSDIRTAFSDIALTINEPICGGDASAARWLLQAIHTEGSPAVPVPSTGRQVTIAGCTVGHWAEGKIIEEWDFVDWLGLFHQLGVIPPLDYYRGDRDPWAPYKVASDQAQEC